MDAVIGVDAYKGGWVTVALSDRSVKRCGVYARFEELLEDHREASVIGVDIPIGLPASAAREADTLARKFVGPRRSSVFPTPPRTVLEAASYPEALAMCRSLGVPGISKQSFGLGPKILEVDELVRNDDRIHEVHPEVSFRAMAGQTLKYSKKSWNGAAIRRQLLAQHDIVLPDDLGEAGLAPVDDVLDAAAAAWTADRIASGKGQASRVLPKNSPMAARPPSGIEERMRVKGSLPELVRKGVERDVGRYCEERVPSHLRDKIRIEYELRGNSVTIVERRPPWREDFGPDWSRQTIAQLRYEEGKWALYWSDRNSRWHPYEEQFEPTPDLSAVLAEIDDDPTAIFWG